MSFTLRLDGEPHRLTLSALKPALRMEVAGAVHRVAEVSRNGVGRIVEIDGVAVTCRVARSGNTVFVHLGGRTHTVELVDPRDAAKAELAGADDVRAPMPGAVVSIEKAPGDPVLLGESLVVIESMKLLTNLTAPRDGVIDAVHHAVGDTFDKDAVLVTLVPENDDA